MIPREGDLPEFTEMMLQDLADTAPDIVHVLRKYMPKPPPGIALDMGAIVKTIREYVEFFSGYWDVPKQSAFLSQMEKAMEWLGAINDYIAKQETTE